MLDGSFHRLRQLLLLKSVEEKQILFFWMSHHNSPLVPETETETETETEKKGDADGAVVIRCIRQRL